MSSTAPLTEFAQALLHYVAAELHSHDQEADYCQAAVAILDAQNHLFRTLDNQGTDEEQGYYALRELCQMDEESMQLQPSLARCLAVGRDFGLSDER